MRDGIVEGIETVVGWISHNVIDIFWHYVEVVNSGWVRWPDIYCEVSNSIEYNKTSQVYICFSRVE